MFWLLGRTFECDKLQREASKERKTTYGTTSVCTYIKMSLPWGLTRIGWSKNPKVNWASIYTLAYFDLLTRYLGLTLNLGYLGLTLSLHHKPLLGFFLWGNNISIKSSKHGIKSPCLPNSRVVTPNSAPKEKKTKRPQWRLKHWVLTAYCAQGLVLQ